MPHTVREELNRRLQEGETGVQLVAWLNGLPDTQRVPADCFGGRPVNEQNLSAWKAGGYREWVVRREVLAPAGEVAAAAGELKEITEGRMLDDLATVLAAHYAALMADLRQAGTGEFRRRLRVLRGLTQDIVALRRGDHRRARLELDWERLEYKREKTDAGKARLPGYTLAKRPWDLETRWAEAPKIGRVNDLVTVPSPLPAPPAILSESGNCRRVPKTPLEGVMDGPGTVAIKADKGESSQNRFDGMGTDATRLPATVGSGGGPVLPVAADVAVPLHPGPLVWIEGARVEPGPPMPPEFRGTNREIWLVEFLPAGEGRGEKERLRPQQKRPPIRTRRPPVKRSWVRATATPSRSGNKNLA